MLNIPCCPVCKQRGIKGRESGGFAYYKCVYCQCLFLFPVPSHHELEKIYNTEVGATFHRHSEMVNEFEKCLEAKIRIKLIIGQLKKGSVLEIGSGAGFLLRELSLRGIECEGIEASEQLCRFGAEKLGVKIRCGLFESARQFNRRYQNILMFNVLSHLPEPVSSLREIRSLLEPGGRVIIETGNGGDSLPAWVDPGAPDHIVHYSRKAILTLAKNCGFTVRTIRSLSALPQLLLLKASGMLRRKKGKGGSESHGDPLHTHPNPGILKRVFITVSLKARYEFDFFPADGTFSNLVVVLEKPDVHR